MINIKTKKYIVEVRSHSSAEMIVFANSKAEAYEIADKDMAESMERQLKAAKPNSFIKNLTGFTEVLKSNIKVVQE